MTADLSPVMNVIVGLGATAISVFGSLALSAIARHFNVQVSAGQTQAFDAALNKSITFGATQLEREIKAKGWDSPDVKSAALDQALTTIADRFPAALQGVGLSTDMSDPRNRQVITDALARALPAAFATAAASPATPPSPPTAAP